MSERAFELLHPKIQQAIWDQNWRELRALQADSIREFFGSQAPLILSAATASGKTEAAFLPVLSAIANKPKASIQALYVGPLKALINDQFERLEQLCRHAQIPVHRWHGDVSQSQKQKLRQNPRGVLLITPESLESNFINYGHQISTIYAHLDFVVIDELHSFLDNTRGIHLRSLLSRLVLETGRIPRLLGLSATLGDFEQAKAFLSPDEPGLTKVIQDEGYQREVKLRIQAFLRHEETDPEEQEVEDESAPIANSPKEVIRMVSAILSDDLERNPGNPLERSQKKAGDTIAEPTLPAIAADLAERMSSRSNLIFCNSRRLTEQIADCLNSYTRANRWPRNPFFLHHGSLSTEVRLEAERRLKDGEEVSVVCTSTLEMGIDIGSVRAVGQVGAPFSVNSMVQRLGRSGRKEGESAILRIYTIDDPPAPGDDLADLFFPDLLRSVALVRLMIKRWLEPPQVERFNASTLVHQLLSILKQTGGRDAHYLYQVLCEHGPFRAFDAETFKRVLRSLHGNEVIEQIPTGEIILAPIGERITSSRDFYASFASTEEYSVRYKGQEIATIPYDCIPPEGKRVILNGRRWQVASIDTESRTVEVEPARGAEAPTFGGSVGDIHSRIVAEMRGVLMETEPIPFVCPDGNHLITAARTLFKKSGLQKSSIIRGASAYVWFPWKGSRAVRTLQTAAKALNLSCSADRHFLSLRFPPDEDRFLEFLRETQSESLGAAELASLLPIKHFGRFDELLDEDLLDEINGVDRLDIEGAKDACTEALLQFQNSKRLNLRERPS